MTSDECFHDAYMDAWNRALDSGGAAPIEELLAPTFHGWVAASVDDPVAYTTQQGLEGFRSAVRGARGRRAQAVGRSVAWRGEDEAIVLYELRLTEGEEIVARSVLVESWRKGEDGWRLHRDLTEHGAGFAAAVGSPTTPPRAG